MGQHDTRHPATPAPPQNVQSRGGIGRRAGGAADARVNPRAGSPKGAVDVAGPSLDTGDGAAVHDGRAHSGFTGDDGTHLPTDATGTPASRQPGPVGDLGAQQDQRVHGIPEDPAERMTGADTPNAGGIAGSPGGPRKATRVPDQDDEAATMGIGVLPDARSRQLTLCAIGANTDTDEAWVNRGCGKRIGNVNSFQLSPCRCFARVSQSRLSAVAG